MLNRKIFLYLFITFIITWGSWFTVSALSDQGSLKSPLFIIYIFGGFGPTISAFITKRFFSDKIEYKEFLKQIIRAKVNVGWYLFIFTAPLVLTFFPWLVNSILTGKQQVIIQQPVYMLFAMIPVMIIGGGLEELGWRGVLLPELLKKKSILASTIIVSVIWVTWHIPLWFINWVPQYGSNFVEFAFSVVGLTLLISILYIRTKSIFMCILFHSLINSYMAIFSTPSSGVIAETVSIAVRFIICISIFIVILKHNRKNTFTNTEAA